MEGFQCMFTCFVESDDSLYIIDKLVFYEYIMNTLISTYLSVPFN